MLAAQLDRAAPDPDVHTAAFAAATEKIEVLYANQTRFASRMPEACSRIHLARPLRATEKRAG